MSQELWATIEKIREGDIKGRGVKVAVQFPYCASVSLSVFQLLHNFKGAILNSIRPA